MRRYPLTRVTSDLFSQPHMGTNGKLTFTSHFISVQKEKNDGLSGVVGITIGLTTVNQKKRKGSSADIDRMSYLIL